MNQFNWDQAFTLDFNLNNGLSKHADTTKRYLSQMKNMYQDQEAVEEILKHEDPLIYEFYEHRPRPYFCIIHYAMCCEER